MFPEKPNLCRHGFIYSKLHTQSMEHSGSVVERLTRDQKAGVPASPVSLGCVFSKNINPSLVLVQPRKTCPFTTERWLMGRKESNQTNKTYTEPRKLLSYDVSSGSEITPCNKIDKPLVVYRFSGNVMTNVVHIMTKL